MFSFTEKCNELHCSEMQIDCHVSIKELLEQTTSFEISFECVCVYVCLFVQFCSLYLFFF